MTENRVTPRQPERRRSHRGRALARAAFVVTTFAVGCVGTAERPREKRPAAEITEGDAGLADSPQSLEPGECDRLAQQAIESFYATHGERWELNIRATAPNEALRPKSGDCSSGSELSLAFESAELELSLALELRCAELHSASVDDLNRAAPVLLLGLLPTGLEIAGCPQVFNALPPSSHVDDAVEFVEITDGRALLRVRTRLFSVQGWNHDRDVCPLELDGQAPEHCYASVRRDIALDATLDLPIDIAAIESRL